MSQPSPGARLEGPISYPKRERRPRWGAWYLPLSLTLLAPLCWPSRAAAQSCNIVIESGSVKAYIDGLGFPAEILVRGMASGEPTPSTADVRLEFRRPDGSVYHTTPTVSSPVNNGLWEASFQTPSHWPPTGARCGIPLDIYASLPGYTAGPACTPDAQLSVATLTCERPSNCLDNAALQYLIKDASGTDVTSLVDGPGCFDANAAYTVELTAPPVTPDQVRWDVDGIANWAVGVTQLTILMPSVGNRTVDVYIDQPAPCPDLHQNIHLLNCSPPLIRGCTDPGAQNYDPHATVDDGSCRYNGPKLGCTDPNALNYDPHATVDDGSCRYDDGGGQSFCGVFDWCCWLLALFAILYIAFWVMWHYNVLPAAWYVGIGALVALILWVIICKPTFCAVLLVLFAAGIVALAIIGVVALVPGAPNPVAVISSAAGSYPSVLLTVLTLILIPIVVLAAGCVANCTDALTCLQVLWDNATTGCPTCEP